MEAQRANRPAGSGDTPVGFAVAVVREGVAWRCSPMRPAGADQPCRRGDRAAGIAQRRSGVRTPRRRRRVLRHRAAGPVGTRLLLSDATAALDYDIAAEALEKLDADIATEDLEDADPFEEGDLGVLADIGLPEAVLGVILSETDLYADEQIGRIAREMGFAEELSAVLDRLDR